ncbi:MAG: lysophospholipid acyltransferase family protein [Burkholderiales bacterium]
MHRQRTVTIETAAWQYDAWIAAKDVVTSARLACCLIAACLPARAWPATARLMASAHLRLRRETIRLLEKSDACRGRSAASLAQEAVAADYLWNIQAIREILPGGSSGEPSLVGRDVLDRALGRSRGAVLWCSPFVGSDLAPKKALALAGYPVTQLSSPFHPFSTTRIGAPLLNPIRLRAINRYTTNRVLVVYGNSRPALEVLARVLSQNGIVLVMAIGIGKHSLTFPFMGGVTELAVGAPRLACDTGAALIPVFTLPDENCGYQVKLGPDLTQGESDHPPSVDQLAARYVELLEPVVRAHPAQWEGWFHPGTWRPLA